MCSSEIDNFNTPVKSTVIIAAAGLTALFLPKLVEKVSCFPDIQHTEYHSFCCVESLQVLESFKSLAQSKIEITCLTATVDRVYLLGLVRLR